MNATGFCFLEENAFTTVCGEQQQDMARKKPDHNIQAHTSVSLYIRPDVKNQGILNPLSSAGKTLATFGIRGLPFIQEVNRGTKLIQRHPCLGSLERDERRSKNKKITFAHSLRIPLLSDLAMAGAAHYYGKKYGIKIHIVISETFDGLKDFVEKLANTIKPDSKIGLIVRIGKTSQHVMPIIIQNSNEQTTIITLDSTAKHTLNDCIRKINTDAGKNLIKLLIVNEGHSRQRDNYSCRSDAVLILKDALRSPVFTSHMKSDTLTKIPFDIRNGCMKIYRLDRLPMCLSKTTQSQSMIDALKLSDALITPTGSDDESELTQTTMKSHLDKYQRTFKAFVEDNDAINDCNNCSHPDWSMVKQPCTREENLYLHTKGYDLVCKAFDQLNDGKGNIDSEKKNELKEKYITHHQQAAKMHCYFH